MIARKIDSLGRIVIPVELRQKLQVKPNDEVGIELVDETIILTNPKLSDSKTKFETIMSEKGLTYDDVIEKLK